MALIELELAPAWKRVVTTDEPETAEVAETEPTTAPRGRRIVTVPRLVVLGVVVGAVAMARRLMGEEASIPEQATIDVETPDEAEAEH